MYLKYGSYTHSVGEAAVAIVRTPLLTESGVQYGVEETWSIKGRLTASTQLALNTAISTLLFAYSVNYQSLGLFLDDGTLTAHALPGKTPLGGVVVVGGPSFEEGSGAEFSTFRNYSIQLRGKYQAAQAGAPQDPGFTGGLITFSETLVFSGGGPRFIFLQPLQGLPVRQMVAEATPYQIVQQGTATGLLTWPIPPAPIWPAAEHRDRRRITPKSPNRQGGNSAKFSEFVVDWYYEFESAVPLGGQPTYWR